MFAEEFLPVYDVSDEVATVVAAEPQAVWQALLEADLIEVGRRTPLAGLLGALRVLPELVSHLLHGERPPHAPATLRLRELTGLPPDQGGWVLLGERPGEELALGLVGKFWRPVIEYAQVPADRFRDFDEPGYAKTIYALSVRPLADGRSLLSGLMRTATTDEHARRWFRRYWTFGVGSGAHILVHALLEMIRETAEGAQTAADREGGGTMRAGTAAAVVALGGVLLYRWLGRERVLNWGTEEAEADARLPGDELLEDADVVATRAITVDAPPSAVWPWIAQMGPEPRGGAYTYDWIENLFGLNMHSTDRVLPEFQHPAPGDTIGAGNNPMRIEVVEPERVFASRSASGTWVWTFVLQERDGQTRLISRNRLRLPTFASRIGMAPMIPGSLVMERKMLRGIKARAERLAAERAANPPAS